MSLENEGLQYTWEEIKAASARLFGREFPSEDVAEKRLVREYLSHEDCEDARVKDQIALPGYN